MTVQSDLWAAARVDGKKRHFEATIYEKAEHWTFTAKVTAANEDEAWKQLAKDYPKRAYSIQEVR